MACWRLDRFARSVRHLMIALNHFRARDIDFISLHDGIDTSTPAGRFSFTIIAAVAEVKRELIAQRTKAGLQAAKRRGASSSPSMAARRWRDAILVAGRSRTRRTGASPSSRSARRGSRRSSRSLRSSSTSPKRSLPFWASTSRTTESAAGRHRRAR
ncbi:recombinase family protein [Sorangium sp. So ce124]|uniref:recombinase family protein n=1 Tax=Sorangium sp. So ce124 TaxID=3133280 RepID=UPI003F5E6E80